MKGKSKIKQGTVLLIAYVLVVGFVGLGGQVYGEQSDTSGISVTATDTRVTVWDFSITVEGTNTTIIEEGSSAVTFPHTVDQANLVDDVFISLKVFDDTNVGDAIDQGEVWINSTQPGDGTYGAAISQYNNVWDVTEDTTEAYLNMTWSDNEPFLLIGDWEIESVIRDDTEIIDRDDYVSDDTGVPFDVALYRTIAASGGDTTISGTAAPGQTLGTSDGVSWDEVDEVTFSINDDYDLDDHVTDLTHTEEGYTISNDQWTTTYGDIESGNPTHDGTFSPGTADGSYELIIPEGQEPGTYQGTITHYVNQTA